MAQINKAKSASSRRQDVFRTKSPPTTKQPTVSFWNVSILNNFQKKLSSIIDDAAFTSLCTNLQFKKEPSASNGQATVDTTSISNTDDSDGTSTYESFKKNDSFACWLASQEFDASAIVDDGHVDCKIEEVDISGISEEFGTVADDVNVGTFAVSGQHAEDAENGPSKKEKRTPVGDGNTKQSSSRWANTSVEALWKTVVASNSKCFGWSSGEEEEDGMNKAKSNAGEAASSDDANKSVSFVISSVNPPKQKSPFQSKSNYTPVDSCSMLGTPQLVKKQFELYENSGKNGTDTALVETNSLEAYAAASNILSEKEPVVVESPPVVTQMQSVLSTAETPLAGEELIDETSLTSPFVGKKLTDMYSPSTPRLLGEDILDDEPMPTNLMNLFPKEAPECSANITPVQIISKSDNMSNSPTLVFEFSHCSAQQPKGQSGMKPQSSADKLKWVKSRRRLKHTKSSAAEDKCL